MVADVRAQLFTNLSEFGEYASASMDRWVNSLRESTDLLAAGPETQTFATAMIFWIKLHGAFVELPDAYAMFQTLTGGSEIVDCGKRVHAALLALLNALTKSEHIYAQWARNREAHVKTNAYRLQAKDKGKALQDGVEIRALKMHATVEEHWRAIDELLKRHAGCTRYGFDSRADTKVAAAIAQKLQPAVNELASAQVCYMKVAGPPI